MLIIYLKQLTKQNKTAYEEPHVLRGVTSSIFNHLTWLEDEYILKAYF